MAIAFNTAGDSQSTSTTSASVTIPAHSVGDLLAVVIATTRSATTPATAIDTPSEWTKGPDIEAGASSAVRLTLFLKNGDGAESSVSVNLNGSPTFGFGATCLVLTGGIEAANAIDVSDTVVQESGVDITSPDVTASEADVLVLYAYCFDDDISTEADCDSDAGFSGTLRGFEKIATPGNGLAVACSTKVQGSGVTGTCVWSSNADDDAGCAFTVVLKSGAAFPIISDVETDEEIDDKQTAVTVTGGSFEASQGTGKVEISDNASYGSGNVVEQTVTSWGATAIDVTVVLGAMSPGTPRYVWVTNDTDDRNGAGFVVHVHRAQAFGLAASANITASGENTTFQLTAPSGKTTADFGGGRIQDDENPGDTVDLAADEYREDEWCIEAVTNADDVQYEFRTLLEGEVIDAYTVTPKWTVGAAAAAATFTQAIIIG